MHQYFLEVFEFIFFIYCVGLLGTLNLLWPLEQIPNYRRWQEERNTKHKILMLELKLKEQELLKIERDLDEELGNK